MRRLLPLLAILWAFRLSVSAAVFLSWNFNSSVPDNDPATGILSPAIGEGALSFIGGSTNLLGEVGGGSPSDPEVDDDTQVRITRPPAQGTNNKGAGIQIQLSTRGFESLRLSWAQYNSATASRFWRVLFSTDQVNWTEHAVVMQTNSAVWLQHTVSFQQFAALNDAESVFFRLVSEFESTATGGGADEYRAIRDESTYSTAGSWWIDSLTVSGRAIGVPNQAPVISELADLTLFQGKRSDTIPVSISDAETAADDLSITVEVWPTASLTNVVLGGTGGGRTLRFYGAIVGEAEVTIRVEDKDWNRVEGKFKVSVVHEPVEPALAPVFVFWNFNSAESDGAPETGANLPIGGAGDLRVIGVTSQIFGSVGQANTSDPEEMDNSMLRLSGFPAQGTADKSAGIEVFTSTAGLRRIGLMWDQYNSATASRYLAIQYTTNGVDFLDHAIVPNASSSTWLRTRKVSFENVPGVENNLNFGVRIVSAFGPNGAYEAVGSSSTYGTVGTLWLDMLSITGEPMSSASSIASELIEGSLVLSWPIELEGYVLETSDDFTQGWNVFEEIPEISNDLLRVRIAVDGGRRFFRLRKEEALLR